MWVLWLFLLLNDGSLQRTGFDTFTTFAECRGKAVYWAEDFNRVYYDEPITWQFVCLPMQKEPKNP